MFTDKINKVFILFIRFLFDISGPIIGPKNHHASAQDVSLGKDFKIRVYTPELYNEDKVILYYHGGGWIIGGIKAYERIFKYISSNANSILVGVEYRKAPEYKYPQALDDAKNTYDWVTENILKNNKKMKVVLIGDSAGGNLIIELVDQMSAKCFKMLEQIILIYPVVSSSFKSINLKKDKKPRWLNIIGYFMLKYCLKQYKGTLNDKNDLIASNNIQEYSVKTSIMIAENDPLKYSIERWINDPANSKYNIKSVIFPSTYHAFINFSRISSQARKGLAFIVDTLKNQ